VSWKDRLLDLLGFGSKSPPSPQGPQPSVSAPVQSRPGVRRRRLTAVIGLDFGTSCTKCVIGVAGQAIAVPFPGLSPAGNPFLVPTQLWLGSDRSLSLRRTGNARPISGIKVGLMERPLEVRDLGGGNTGTPRALAAAYLAEVLRHARGWLMAQRQDLLSDAEMSWQVNVGLPAKSHEDGQVCGSYRTAIHAACALSQRQMTTYLGVAAEAVSVASATPVSIEAYPSIQIIPEVAAEVVGYARSAQRREGPHFMVDVGATTLDLCLFQLSQEDEGYSYAFYATDVRTDLGAHRLHMRRRSAIDASAHGLGLEDSLAPIPRSFREYPGANGAAEQVDQWFGAETEKAVRIVASRAKQKQRSGLVVEVEKERGIERIKPGEIRVLMCGGGSALPLYVDAVRKAGIALAPNGSTGLRLKPFGIVPGLEYPARLQASGLRRTDFHRIAVAYGLSYSVDNIGRFTPPSEIEPEPHWWLADFQDSRPEND
jgi:hypothetical protein